MARSQRGDYGDMWAVETAVYRLYAENGVLLYVGIAKRPFERIATHRNKKPWAILIHHHTIEWHRNRSKALIAEAEAIGGEAPLFNIELNDGRERPWERMLQHSWQRRPLNWPRITQFAAVAHKEPRLLELLQWVQGLDRVCGDCAWNMLRPELIKLVGFDAENEAVRNAQDYQTVLSTMYEYMPYVSCEKCGAA